MSNPNPDDQPNPELTDAQMTAQKDALLKQVLDSNARLRLNNVRMVKPDVAATVENYLIGMASQGQLRSPISDEQLKQILLSLQQPKRDFKINRR